MYTSISEEEKLGHPYYQIMELKKEELKGELNSWSRLKLIDWLSWNDRNGVYRDEDSIDELGNVLGKKEAIEIMSRQILENQ
ncbi:hypothetical protein [Algibacter lectus]|uniref:hypothetical protein n=1 Tax=Algibacter lectus TaxID=221126 RepID=UPI0024954C7C|nr:hypothetical protein [Algibacter lectus]